MDKNKKNIKDKKLKKVVGGAPDPYDEQVLKKGNDSHDGGGVFVDGPGF